MQAQRRRKRRKHAVEVYKGFTIRNYGSFFQTDSNRRTVGESKRDRRSFQTMKEAKTYIDSKSVERENYGRQAFTLSAADREAAVKALGDLGGRASLEAAIEFWKQHHPEAGAVSVSTLAADWIAELEQSGRRPKTIREAKHRTKAFVEAVGEATPCATVTGETVREFIAGRPGTASTKRGWRRLLLTWFGFAVKRRIIRHNPVAEVEAVKLDEKMPEFMDHKMVSRFMAAAGRLHPEAVAAFAVLFWAGLRPSEVEGQYGLKTAESKPVKRARRGRFAGAGARMGGLKWEDIDLAERIIRVRPETSKTRRTRLVDISDNLLLWLAKYRRTKGPVSPPPPTFRRMRKKIMEDEAVGLKRWTPDTTRHTYASYHFAMHQAVEKLQAQMGHTGKSDVLFRHYRGLAKKTEAEKFWAIEPATVAGTKTVDFTKAAGA